MFGRGWMLAFLLGGAVLPYALSSKSSVREALTAPLSVFNKSDDKKSDAKPATGEQPHEHLAAGSSPHPASPKSTAPQPRSAGELPFVPFEQALSWRVSPAWVMGTWPRVTTTLPELELQGYRVSLVSGTAESDIAGSLTYYFDAKQSLQRITFTGSTGDAKRLVQFLMSQHRFQRRLGEDPSMYLYQVEQDGRALSELKIRAASIVRAGSPLSRFETTLEMRRPEE